eukprot:jgi/Chlat1/5430/Chrsp35S05318
MGCCGSTEAKQERLAEQQAVAEVAAADQRDRVLAAAEARQKQNESRGIKSAAQVARLKEEQSSRPKPEPPQYSGRDGPAMQWRMG